MLVSPDHEIVFQPQIEDGPQQLGSVGQGGSTGGKAGCHQEWDGGADRVHGSVWVRKRCGSRDGIGPCPEMKRVDQETR